MTQVETQEFRVTFNTDSGKTVSVTVPDANLDNITSETAVSIYNAAKVPLTADSSTTLIQSTDGGNVIGIKEAYVLNQVKTWVIESDDNVRSTEE